MRQTVLAAAFGLALAAPFAAPAFANGWTLDKSHAHITFTADHLGFSLVHGQFRSFDADFVFDPENMAATEVAFTIDAASIDTFWAERDEHLRNADFLDVANHPTINFVSTQVTPTSDTTAEIAGDLTMLGETREVVFEATLNKLAPSPFNPNILVAGFSATGEIRRADFGMTFGGEAFATVIPVRIDLEITREQ